jgi:hypothetical protein
VRGGVLWIKAKYGPKILLRLCIMSRLDRFHSKLVAFLNFSPIAGLRRELCTRYQAQQQANVTTETYPHPSKVL